MIGNKSDPRILQTQSLYNNREQSYYENTMYTDHAPEQGFSNNNNLFYRGHQMGYDNTSRQQEMDDSHIFRRAEEPEMVSPHTREGHYIPRQQWHQSQPTNPIQYSNFNHQMHHDNFPSPTSRQVHHSEYNMPNLNDNGSQYGGNVFNNLEDVRAHSVHQMRNPHEGGYSQFPQDRMHVGSTGMPPGQMMGRPHSKRSLYTGANNFLGSGDAHSVRSLQQNIFLNRYEDDCLYMNLEEEYLHKVSKRMGKSENVSINKSMYNLK